MYLRTPNDLGAIVRQRRRELQLDQQTLADRVGVSRQWIVECERGKKRAALGLVLRTLEVLGLRLRIGKEPATRTVRPLEAADIDEVVRRARKPRR